MTYAMQIGDQRNADFMYLWRHTCMQVAMFHKGQNAQARTKDIFDLFTRAGYFVFVCYEHANVLTSFCIRILMLFLVINLRR